MRLSHESTPFGKFETQDASESRQDALCGLRKAWRVNYRTRSRKLLWGLWRAFLRAVVLTAPSGLIVAPLWALTRLLSEADTRLRTENAPESHQNASHAPLRPSAANWTPRRQSPSVSLREPSAATRNNLRPVIPLWEPPTMMRVGSWQTTPLNRIFFPGTSACALYIIYP